MTARFFLVDKQLFAFDLPFLFVCGLFLGYLTGRKQITWNMNLVLSLVLLFIFQAGGIMLWFDVLPGSKEFMIIPLNYLGFTVNDFEPFLAALLFSIEPFLLILGEKVGLERAVEN